MVEILKKAPSVKLGRMFDALFISQISNPTIAKKHRLTLVLLFGLCTLIYYLGELLAFFGWGSVRWLVLDNVHDIHRLLFLAPIMYACYFFGIKSMIVVTIASVIVFLPRAVFISPFPDAIARSLIFIIFAGILCVLIRLGRNNIRKHTQVKAITRNDKTNLIVVQEAIEDFIFTKGALEVNLSKRLVKKRGQIVKLTPKEYELLRCLVRNGGKAMSHTELLNTVWGQEYGQEREYIRNYIRQLRNKIEDDPSNPQFILTESHFGYRFLEFEDTPNNNLF